MKKQLPLFSLTRSIMALSLAVFLVCPELARAKANCADWNTSDFFSDASAADVQRCLDAGADPNRQDAGRTPLHTAASAGNAAAVRVLLAAGADVRARDNESLTPLHRAATTFRGVEIVQVLLDAGADVRARDNEGLTPLHRAAGWRLDMGDSEIAQALLNAGADAQARDNEGATPLHRAASMEPSISRGIVQVLLDAGAEIEARDDEGKTPLHWARSSVTVEPLLAAGAEVDARDKYGRTPLHTLFRDSGYYEAVATLMLKAGADPNAKDNEGRTTGLDVSEFFKASCDIGPTWCENEENPRFNRQTENGKTASICESGDDDLVYYFGTVGQEPELRYAAPLESVGTSIGNMYSGSPGARQFSAATRQSDAIIIKTYRTGFFEEILYAFKSGGWEYHLVKSVGRPMAGMAGYASCDIYVVSPDEEVIVID